MVDFSSYELTLTRFQAIHDMNLQETRHWNEEAQRIGNYYYYNNFNNFIFFQFKLTILCL